MHFSQIKLISLATLSGFLLALGWPTYGVPLLLFVAFVPLLVVEQQLRRTSTRRQGLKVFGLAYLAFVIWNALTTGWLRFADPFGAGFAVFVNAGLMSLLFLLYHKYAKRQSTNRSLLFLVVLWISFEKLHLHWEFSWPWLNLGNGFSEYISWVQWYEYTGTFGGTLWVWLLNVLLFKGVLAYQQHKDNNLIKRAVFQCAVLILLPIGLSLARYSSYSHEGDTINVIALQPNIDPYSEKYNISNLKFAELFFELADSKISADTDFIIAPETFLAQGSPLTKFKNSLVKNKFDRYVAAHPHVNLLTGISFYDMITDPRKVRTETNVYKFKPNTWYDDYNAALLINGKPEIQQYNKSKLVVGVENFPYQDILKPLIGDVMIDLGGTVSMKTTQTDREVFTASNGSFKAAPIICYESVYGEFVTGYVRNEANFLAILTNDAWWNTSQGHKQHLSYAKLRAVETRRDIVRSANTGISAIISAKGDITSRLAYGEKGALAGQLKSNTKTTFYVMAGDYIARISVFILVFVGLIGFFRRKKEPF